MINSDFIIDYTNALYSTPAEYAPRYDEFRDMFSAGQLASKEWLIKELLNLKLKFNTSIVVGSWYGTLGLLLHKYFPNTKITLLDIDPRCEKFIHNVIYNKKNINVVTQDMYEYNYSENLVINTSCEHIKDIKPWINKLPKNTLVALQSNNFTNGNGHINCVNSINEFINNTNLKNILYSGELPMSMYTRYMIIGYTNE